MLDLFDQIRQSILIKNHKAHEFIGLKLKEKIRTNSAGRAKRGNRQIKFFEFSFHVFEFDVDVTKKHKRRKK